jgi:hypothetical protein
MSTVSKKSNTCKCGEPVTKECVSCKRKVCEDGNCGTETVDGFLCGTYTQWGCARKYTTCDDCYDELAIHEEDLHYCQECGTCRCDKCVEKHTCED